MTTKQIYAQLAQIMGHRCSDGKPFFSSKKVTKAHVQIVQGRLVSLLEKINYERTRRDFRREFARPTDRPVQARVRLTDALFDGSLGRLSGSAQMLGTGPVPPSPAMSEWINSRVTWSDVAGGDPDE